MVLFFVPSATQLRDGVVPVLEIIDKKEKIQQSITEELSIKDIKINVTYFYVLLGCKKCNVPSATLRPLRNIILKYALLSIFVQPNQCIYFHN